MWAMMPILRTFVKSKFAMISPRSNSSLALRVSMCTPIRSSSEVNYAWSVACRQNKKSVVRGYFMATTDHGLWTTNQRLPGDVYERRVRVGHLDRVFSLRHDLALLAVGGPHFV